MLKARSGVQIAWLTPAVTLILAATAIPIEWRSPSQTKFALGFYPGDFVANVLGYVPLGILLGAASAGAGLARAAKVAAAISLFAEISQVVMMHRDPSLVDVVANVLGGVLGAAAVARWRIDLSAFRIIQRWHAFAAAMLAFVLVLGVWATSGYPVSARGATAPGELEAHWTFDEPGGGRAAALDSSGHGLNGTFRGNPLRVPGMLGGAVKLDGSSDYIDFGHSTAFRLEGSMTITAWISSTSYPFDDAPIVSSHDGVGYQLDTTVDKGPRTIGFKLGDECGRLMARYGKTTLALNTWYHVAGVYDSGARTVDVYLNGELDNGALQGSGFGGQRSSRQAVYVGKRANVRGHDFAGAIDDVQIYSRALTKADIGAVMRGAPIAAAGSSAPQPHQRTDSPAATAVRPCAVATDQADAKIPGAAATLGVLVAVVCAGLWPFAGKLFYLAASFAAGLLLVPPTATTMPAINLWLLPLISLLGGVAVVVSLTRFRPGSEG